MVHRPCLRWTIAPPPSSTDSACARLPRERKLARTPPTGPARVCSDWMNMGDANTGEILWQDNEWGDLLTERDIHLPKRILQCRAVSREFQFSSVEMLQGLRLEQRIFFRGGLMEQWHFHFGFELIERYDFHHCLCVSRCIAGRFRFEVEHHAIHWSAQCLVFQSDAGVGSSCFEIR